MYKHWLRYGTAAEQKHMIEYKNKYEGIVINASMLAHTSKSIAKFMHNEVNNKPFFIDPMTHAFQHDLGKIQNDKGEIKSSIQKLINQYGEPIKTKIEKGQPVKKDDFTDENILEFVEHVLDFQYRHIFASLDSELRPYVEYMGGNKLPEWLISPYFYMTKLNYTKWFLVNKELISKSMIYKKEYKLDVYAQLVIDKNLLVDETIMSEIIDSYSEADGLIYWIDSFDETSASLDELKAIFNFIYKYKSQNPSKPIYSLYGGYFSQLLMKFGLTGVVHGLEYGENRGVAPVGGGIPRSKFYLPALRKRIAGNMMAPIVHYEARNADEFYQNICDCLICKKNIEETSIEREQVTDNFSKKYLASKAVEIKYKDPNRANRASEYPLQESKIECLHHYLEVKYKEFSQIEKISISKLLEELKEAKIRFGQYFSIDEIAYLDRWVDVLKDD